MMAVITPSVFVLHCFVRIAFTPTFMGCPALEVMKRELELAVEAIGGNTFPPTNLVPAGGSAIVEFGLDVPGTLVIVDHALFRRHCRNAFGVDINETLIQVSNALSQVASYPENVDRRIFLDNFTLLPNAARNGDLEDSATEALGWVEQPSNGLATFALDTTQAHTGQNSLRVDVGEVAADANRWDIDSGVANIRV